MQVKLAIIGPAKSGKTTILRIIREALETSGITVLASDLPVDSSPNTTSSLARRLKAMADSGVTVKIDVTLTQDEKSVQFLR